MSRLPRSEWISRVLRVATLPVGLFLAAGQILSLIQLRASVRQSTIERRGRKSESPAADLSENQRAGGPVTLGAAIGAYQRALDALPTNASPDASMLTLRAIVARDDLARLMASKLPGRAEDVIELTSLDERLKVHAVTIDAVVGRATLKSWREAVQPPPSAWWWTLDEQAAASESRPHPVWDFLAGTLILTVSLSLTADIARRFLVEGASFLGVFSTLSGVLLSIMGGTAYTKVGSQSIDQALQRLGVKRGHLRFARAAVALSFLLMVVVLRLSLPSFAVYFNNQGERLHDRQLTQAIEHYQRAISLNPDYAEPHYNLANAFEDALDFDRAILEYLATIRLRPKSYPAMNNLARLFVLRKNEPATALTLLDDTLALEPTEDVVRYSIYKNRGWANLSLGLFSEAETDLRRALAISFDAAAAHCLLAQVLEAPQNLNRDEDLAIQAWAQCLTYAPSQRKSVESSWIAMAQARMRAMEKR